jgi:flavin reductase (DIM6/NTAB) family NADH-FMN oxidoreductase RutF
MRVLDFVKVLKATKAPFLPAIIVCCDKNGKSNPITVEWYMRTSIQPPMFAISIGNDRYSYQCLQECRKFNIVLCSKDFGDAVKLFGSKSGKDTDKIKDSGLKTFKGKLGLEIFEDSRAAYECETVTQVKSGDHTIFVGEVKYSWLNEETSELIVFPDKS